MNWQTGPSFTHNYAALGDLSEIQAAERSIKVWTAAEGIRHRPPP